MTNHQKGFLTEPNNEIISHDKTQALAISQYVIPIDIEIFVHN